MPCPAGTYANATGLSSEDQCIRVPPGFYAATGSAVADPCPGSAFFCPGAAEDDVHDPPGSKPIILPVGSTTEITKEIVEKTVVEEKVRGQPLSLITLSLRPHMPWCRSSPHLPLPCHNLR